MRPKLNIISILVLLLFQVITNTVTGQTELKSSLTGTNDSLVLQDVLKVVIQNYPSIKQAEEALNAADAKIGFSRAGYMPNIEVNASYSRIGPVPSFDFPGFGKISLYPADNYATSLNYQQIIYDFGKTSKAVQLETENKNLYSQNIELVKQKLALLSTSVFYSLNYLQEAIKIKTEELNTLRAHLVIIEKKKSTGSATDYELLATKVKISGTESQLIDLESMHKTQQSVLNSLLGLPGNADNKVKALDNNLSTLIQEDSLINYAFQHRIEIAMAKEKENLAQLQLNVVQSQDYPVLSGFVTAGAKNGYIPDLYKFKPNYVAGIGLRVPIFDGNRKKYSSLQVKSTLVSSSFESDLVKRNVSNEVLEANENQKAAYLKISQFELQLNQAEEAFKLARLSYQTGAITNLDLLDAETRVSESKLLLLKAKVDYVLTSSKLKTALGDRLY